MIWQSSVQQASSKNKICTPQRQPPNENRLPQQGYTLVGCAIEGASGEKYADYVHENVLVPAGMLHTRPDDRFAIILLRTRFYSKTNLALW